MKLIQARIRGFRRLEDVSIEFEESETVFVGPNNSGKTSATDIFRLFLKSGDFSVHDFSVSQVVKLDQYGRGEIDEQDGLPHIDLDLWFSIDPDTEFGRTSVLLPDTEQDYDKVGLRLRYMVSDPEELKKDYLARLIPQAGGTPKKPLSHYLTLPGTLRQHFTVAYYALEGSIADAVEKSLAPEEGKRVLRSLVRVEFVDAQRKIDDYEHVGSTRLSKLFTGYYKRNLTQAQAAEAANELIDKHNDELTGHYAIVFADLLQVIQGLGVPSVNDRSLRVTSSLVAEAVLQSNTTLTYFDAIRGHELPEKYNGLGVKNLIYLAIQICEFHLNWMKTQDERPLALVLFIEEPEVHLHAQAQQTFIANAWRIIQDASKRCGEQTKSPQLVVTTHSSHILDTVDFANVRYFRRCNCAGEAPSSTTTLNASTVLNLRRFNPLPDSSARGNGEADNAAASDGAVDVHANESAETKKPGTDGRKCKEEARETLDFLKRYLHLTHCDLFFADAAVLVEGTVEKLLLPEMITLVSPGLRQRYLSILEVGGAFAHRFAALLEFISIPYLVITDIDSVDPKNNRTACRADTPDAVSSNGALAFFLHSSSIKDLVGIDDNAQYLKERRCYVTYQRPSMVTGYEANALMHGRTFEETFVHENISLFRNGSLHLVKEWETQQDHEAEYSAIYEAVNSRTFKKTEFALSVASTNAKWVTPKYIADGLKWLQAQLRATVPDTQGGSVG
jgi:putative ATP-dependent endonuclease of the OLD family